ncbi:uncharacterized protein LOC113352522 [Papaver somniferum]|uniref:uncharacterized protein LOC113352522 n=1 Tax=Papaver somniferum TaxID=3469 RepID=UPI000E7029AB|nr:uncharacterized protein LOC113352522 [Papaver somniferum]
MSCLHTHQQYRPIGLSNVSFKIFTKIIASRMSGLMHKLVSPQQAAYIKGINIQDQIILASEMVNEMKKKRRNGPNGFFPVGRGLRQEDPLSPLLFVLMEDVLSRNITKLVMEGKINPMLLEDYQDSSGQVINKNKSKLFVDGTTAARVIQIKEMMQMEVSNLPDKYLGVILHAGRVKIATVWPVVEMMQKKLASWNDKLLFFNDRLVLIKSVLCSVPIYSMSIYQWPKSVIKICEKIIRNFMWSGDGDIRKFKTLSWKKVCSPYSEGGLGLQRLEILNKALLMKILWRIINSEAEWALFIKAKFKYIHQQWKCNWKLSSIWPGLKGAWNHLKENIRWCLGNGQKISFWYDSWLGNTPIIEEVGLTEYVKNYINLKVSDLILDGKWNVPEELKPIIAHYTLPAIGVGEDILVWKEDIKACAILKYLWFQKNKMWFEQIKPNLQSFKARIKKTIYEGSLRMKRNKWNSDIDNQVILFFKLEPRKIRFQSIKSCHWNPPCPGFIMFCCDGASIGNPGFAGFGVVIRDHMSQVLGVITGGIGIATNYIAEVYAVISAVELDVKWGMHKVILVSDSKTVITEFEHNKMPWFVRMRWQKAIKQIQNIQFLHSYRETNFVADTAAKKEPNWLQGKDKYLLEDLDFWIE